MKKIISILIAFIVLLSTASIFTITSFAQETTKYWEPRPNTQGALGCVNDEPADGVYLVADEEYDATRIEYLGDGRLTGWEFPTLTEGKDYKIIKQHDNIIIVKFTDGVPYINALVDFSDTADSTADYSNQTITQGESKKNEEQREDGSITNTADYTKADNQDDSNYVTIQTNRNGAQTMSVDAPEHNILNATNIGLICLCTGTAVCVLVVLVIKKKSADKN